MAFTTNGNMHRHMRIHEKELSGSAISIANPDSPQSLVISPSSRGKKRPIPRVSGEPGGWSRNLFNDELRMKRKLGFDDGGQNPVKRISHGVLDLCRGNKTEVYSDEQSISADDLSVSASSSQQVGFLHCFPVSSWYHWHQIRCNFKIHQQFSTL